MRERKREGERDNDEDLRKIEWKHDSSGTMAVLRFTNLAQNWSAAGSRMNKSVNKVIEYFENQDLTRKKEDDENSRMFFFRV